MEEARKLNHSYVGTEHILLGLIQTQEGVAAQVLMNLGLKFEVVREAVLNLLSFGSEELSLHNRFAVSNNPSYAQKPFGRILATPKRPIAAPREIKSLSLNDLFRILDAASNRTHEGLRVIEDYVRFVLDDHYLTQLCKELPPRSYRCIVTAFYREPHGRARNSGRRRHGDHYQFRTLPRGLGRRFEG